MEASIRSHRDQAQKNTKGFRDRLGQLNSEKSALNASITDLNNKLKAVTAERDLLKSTESTIDTSRELAQQLETLRREKAEVENMLKEEKAKLPASTAPDESASIIVCVHMLRDIRQRFTVSLQASLREERDKLLTEKASWISKSGDAASTDSAADEARRAWEAERGELVKARDEAITQAKVLFYLCSDVVILIFPFQAANEAAVKATEQAKNVQFSNVSLRGFSCSLLTSQKTGEVPSKNPGFTKGEAVRCRTRHFFPRKRHRSSH